jgi:hypothetical protein
MPLRFQQNGAKIFQCAVEYPFRFSEERKRAETNLDKSKPPAEATKLRRAVCWKELLLLFLGFGSSGLRSLRLGHALLEFINASGGIHKFLLAGVERMAGIANADDNRLFHRAGFDNVAAGATDFRFLVIRMNVSFHKKAAQTSSVLADDKGEFSRNLAQKRKNQNRFGFKFFPSGRESRPIG